MELEDKGYFTGWKQVGSVYVAQTKERLHYYKRCLQNEYELYCLES